MTRSCSRCGKPLTLTPYELWLFHCCRSCYADQSTRKWTDSIGSERKWRYVPRWHLGATDGGDRDD
jgi:hypothetical protein